MSPGETAALILGVIAVGVLLSVFIVAVATSWRRRGAAALRLRCGRCGWEYHVRREHSRACPRCAVEGTSS